MTSQAAILTRYFHLMNVNGAAHVYREALRAGVLDALAAGPGDAAGVAQATGLAERPVGLLLDALAALGLLEPDEEGRHRLTPLARWLLAGSYRDLGDPYWSHLPAFLRTGTPMARMDSPAESEAHYQGQAAALAFMLAPAAEAAARTLDAGRSLAGSAILDVGAGSAIWSLTVAAQAPGATVTAVDWPAVLPVATGTARRLGLESRLTLRPGDYHRVELPAAAFDLAILGNVTHLETPAGNLDLFRRVRPALRRGGRLAIFDLFPGLAAGDLNRALYALGLALRTERGRVYPPGELEALLRQAGFSPARLIPLDVPPHAVGMLLAEAS